METKFDKVKDFFEKPNYLLNTVNIGIRRAIINEFFPSIHGKKILDIGCGDGSLSLRFSTENKIVLLDGATRMIEAAKVNLLTTGDKNNVTFVQGDIFKYEDESKFDLILCIGVISHIDDVNKMLDKINFLLRPDGNAIIQFSNADHFRYKRKKSSNKPGGYGYSLNTFNEAKFYQLTKAAGLTFIEKRGYCWQFPIMDRLSPSIQIGILSALRKNRLFHFLNSEWLVLFKKKEIL